MNKLLKKLLVSLTVTSFILTVGLLVNDHERFPDSHERFPDSSPTNYLANDHERFPDSSISNT
ncbi:hypothetical protein [Pseudalkalibacillus caeni]|uniref:Phosphatase n=1 Tax=Exobacillus caeni TaxID=2574798 RepID=A0A5R9F469_9BACL|nr:hypothetical protein [Pseudalkalibacillus caeni]TLS38482.1 hypothetical protein FCL54_04915 [Pseudalkalibacillus caeni]